MNKQELLFRFIQLAVVTLVVLSAGFVTVPSEQHPELDEHPSGGTATSSEHVPASNLVNDSTNTTSTTRVPLVITFTTFAARDTAVLDQSNLTVISGREIDVAPVLFVTAPPAMIDDIEARSTVDEVVIDRRIGTPPGPDRTSVETEDTTLTTANTQSTPWGAERIQAQDVTDRVSPDEQANVTVAVLDTGIDYTHPDLTANVVWGANFSNDGEQYGHSTANDNNGHGTAVAGIIAAEDNDQGVVGVAPNATLYSIKVLNADAIGRYSWWIKGIDAAIKGPDGQLGTADDADIISSSLGGSVDDTTLESTIQWASQYALFPTAAGNDGDGDPSTNEVKYPAKYPDAIAIGATDRDNVTAGFSAEGDEIELSAPGVTVETTKRGGGTQYFSGTSVATPHVSGAMALVLAADLRDGSQDLSLSEVRQLFGKTALDIEDPGRDRWSGYGLIQTDDALDAAAEQMIAGVDVWTTDGTLIADGDDTEMAYLQLEDEDGDPVKWQGVTTEFAITSGNADPAGVHVTDASLTTNESGIATVRYNATNVSHSIEVTGQTTSLSSNYTDTATFETVPGSVDPDRSSASFDGMETDPTSPTVASEHTVATTIRDSNGWPIPNESVTFSSNSSDVTFGAAIGTTKASGQYSTTVTLPERTGTISVNVTAGSFNASTAAAARFNVSTKAENATTLEFRNGTRSIPVTTTRMVKVAAVDQYGNVDTSYSSPITLSSNDVTTLDFGAGVANSTPASVEDGIKVFDVRANGTTGNATLMATSDGLSGMSAMFEIDVPSAIDVWFAHDISTSESARQSTTMYAQLVDTIGEKMAIDGEPITLTIASGDSAVLAGNESHITAVTNETGIVSVQVDATATTGETAISASADTFSVTETGKVTTTGPATRIAVEPAVANSMPNTSVNVNVRYVDQAGRTVPKTAPLTVQTDLGFLDDDTTPMSTTATPILHRNDGATASVTLKSSKTGVSTLKASDDGVNGSAKVNITESLAQPPVVNDQFPGAPTDTDGDGTYEDVNGDGEFNVNDVTALWTNRNSDAVQTNPAQFDVNGDGTFDVNDITALWNDHLAS